MTDTFPSLIERLHIKSYDVDRTGRLKPHSLLHYFQEIAGVHATDLGVGYEELQRRGMFWVLSRLRIGITRMPSWQEPVALETRPVGVNRLFALREFTMRDEHDEVLLTALTGWLLLDRDKNRPCRIQTLPLAQHLQVERQPPSGFLDKLKASGELDIMYDKRVLSCDLDVNDHVNNAEYLRWIMDCFSPDEVGRRSLRSVQVHYLDAAVFGETIALSRGRDAEGGSYYIEGTNIGSGTKVFQAVVGWG